jgi:hypothetical protein
MGEGKCTYMYACVSLPWLRLQIMGFVKASLGGVLIMLSVVVRIA